MMIKILTIFIISSVLLYNSFRIVDFINTKEDEKIVDKKIYRLVISTLTSIFVVCLFLKYSISIRFLKFFLLLIFLMISGYIDHLTKNVYTFFSRIFLVIGILFSIYELIGGADIKILLIGILGTFLVSSILALFKLLGWGDVEVFTIIAIFIGGFSSIFNVFLASAISGIGTIFYLITKKHNVHNKLALCPYIAISTILIILTM